MYSSLSIANQFIKLAKIQRIPMKSIQLQKLVHIAHGWHLAITNQKLVEDDLQAWSVGAIFPKLYHATKQYGLNPIPDYICWGDDGPDNLKTNIIAEEDLSEESYKIIEKVWEFYHEYPAHQLSALTHSEETPWNKIQNGSQNHVIPDDLIKNYFLKFVEVS